MTLGEWLDNWIDLYVKGSGLAENTVACYNRSMRALPADLRCLPLGELSPLDLRRWLLDVAREHPRAAQLDRIMLRRALKLAAKAGLCSHALYDADLLPEIPHQAAKADILDADQLRAYMAAAADAPHGVPLMLLACGLRRGEALGARWEALDMSAGTLAIVGQRLPGSDTLAPLKTAASRRVVQLPSLVIRRLLREPRPITGGWLDPISARQLYKVHDALLARCALPRVTLHGLRHSLATAAVLQGVPIKALQAALGHAQYQITADLYADHLPSVSMIPAKIYFAG